jgi:hypothetical protein
MGIQQKKELNPPRMHDPHPQSTWDCIATHYQ